MILFIIVPRPCPALVFYFWFSFIKKKNKTEIEMQKNNLDNIKSKCMWEKNSEEIPFSVCTKQSDVILHDTN